MNTDQHPAIAEAVDRICYYTGDSSPTHFTWIVATAVEQVLAVEKVKAYYDGYRAGLNEYAWWKDGTEYVGTCGVLLKDAIAIVRRYENNSLAEVARKQKDQPHD